MELTSDKSIFALSRLGVLRFTGCDAASFLQGQITGDITRINTELQPTGYCDPKGRLLAVFYLTREDASFFAIASKDTLETLARRLTLYTLRRDVTVSIEQNYAVCGSFAPEVFPVNTPLYTKETVTLALTQAVPDQPADETVWWEAAAHALIPFVFSQTQGRFLPQSLNLDLIGGVSFNKGCYVGQEIVSRIHAIGHPTRRLALYQGAGSDVVPGSDLLDKDKSPAAVAVYGAGVCTLAECALRDTKTTLYLENGKTLKLISRT